MNLLGGGLVKVNLSSIMDTLIFLWTNNVREQLKYKAHASLPPFGARSGWRELKVSSYTSSSSLERSRKYTKALQKAFRTTPSTPPHFYFYIQYLLLIFLWSLASLSLLPQHTHHNTSKPGSDFKRWLHFSQTLHSSST